MTATVVNLRQASSPRLQCSACGITRDAACDCGVPYVMAGARAAQAVAANPEKSDRAIAAEIGVSHPTVAKARKATGKQLPVEAQRTGVDGKMRKLPRKPTPQETDEMPTAEEADQDWQRTVYDQACLLLERMADETRQRFFAHIRRKYRDK